MVGFAKFANFVAFGLGTAAGLRLFEGRAARGRDRRNQRGLALRSTRPCRGPARRLGDGNVLDESPKQFRYAPRLGEATTGAMRCVPVEHLGNLAKTLVFHVPPEFRQPSCCLFARFRRPPIDLDVGRDKRAHQPWPDSPLMIGAIAAPRIPLIAAAVLRVGRRKTAEAVRR